jgi:aspartate/tyrosine/aromatic aminotransferase
MASIFDGVEKGPPIEVFALNKLFLEDTDSRKVNLGVGGELRNGEELHNIFVNYFKHVRLLYCSN